MAGSNPARRDPPDQVVLPSLTRWPGPTLEDHGDYEALGLVERDLAGQVAVSAAFMGCRIERCRLDDLDLRHARIIESLLADNDATSLNAAEGTWRDSLVTGGRIGALTASTATWSGIRLRGIKLDFLDLSGARVSTTVVEDCVIGELELAEADLRTVRFPGSSIEILGTSNTRLTDVDLSGARLRTIASIAGLRGATLSMDQLIDLAPLLAADAGIRIKGD
jgi:uncharacterized protein YjbI with pentapeptide repeats